MIANFTYIVCIICLLLAGFFTWMEYKRAVKANLLWRLLSVLVAAACLACIALPLSYHTQQSISATRKTILLTPGFATDSLKDIAKALTLDKEIKKAYPKVQLISGADEIDTTRALDVYGYGLKPVELKQLNALPLAFHPSAIPAGVSHISWNKAIKAGEDLIVQGTYNNPSTQKVKLLLKGLNTVLATAVINPGGQSSFTLSTQPKTTGKVVYTLQAVMGNDTITQGDVPVQIIPVKPLKILMLTASPDFETRFLKNWLSENGYAVALRSAISKGKFNTEYINTEQLNLNSLSPATLNKFDVVLGDLSVITALSVAESAVLKQQIADKGLGLIVRADSIGKASWLQKDFPVDRPSGKEPVPSYIKIAGKKSNSDKLNTGPAHIIYRDGTQPIAEGTRGDILANSTILGSGKIVFTTLNNTFSWMLAGNKMDYSALWSTLISKAARKDGDKPNKLSFQTLPLVDEPVDISVTQSEFAPVVINGESTPIAQNPNIPFEWTATYWPSAKGWQELKQGDKTIWWYAYHKQDWPGVQAAERLSATTKYAAAHTANTIVTKQIQQKVQIAVPKIYFYILLLAACTFLWIETKFSL
ncbi:hypothetical protein FFF34_018005 [Inquilinus sp. KBS0705]|nr:hypothetical protein FFF34_018005 [Inquilinus sp. KBS0705]